MAFDYKHLKSSTLFTHIHRRYPNHTSTLPKWGTEQSLVLLRETRAHVGLSDLTASSNFRLSQLFAHSVPLTDLCFMRSRPSQAQTERTGHIFLSMTPTNKTKHCRIQGITALSSFSVLSSSPPASFVSQPKMRPSIPPGGAVSTQIPRRN